MARDFVVPEVGESGMTVTFVRWLKAEGDTVRAGEALFEVDTEKVQLEIEAYVDGTLVGLRAEPGDIIAPHQVLASIEEAEGPVGSPPPGASSSGPRVGESSGPPPAASPKARRLADALNVDLRDAAATGPGGVITEADVRAVADSRGHQRASSTGASE